ncbi:3275_t:CDS:2 [Funneliformis geosporum]|nr:3275_t:CDS:2 [Funneliformis geosporum]
MEKVFHVPAFFIVLRETFECTITLLILIGCLDTFTEGEQLIKSLKKRIWIGTILGLFFSINVCIMLMGLFKEFTINFLEKDPILGAIFLLLASTLITYMAWSMIRINVWKEKLNERMKYATRMNIERSEAQKNFFTFYLISFTVICREAFESYIFIAGVGFNNFSSLIIPILLGLSLGVLLASYFSEACSYIQEAVGIKRVILWKLNCCDPKDNEGWALLNSLFGWTSEGTKATTFGYFFYLIFEIAGIFILYGREKLRKQGNALSQS